MKTLISLFLISFVAFCTISCNDDDKDTPDLANRYGAYEKPHFAFEYASDTIRIGMKPYYEKKIAVTEFKSYCQCHGNPEKWEPISRESSLKKISS